MAPDARVPGTADGVPLDVRLAAMGVRLPDIQAPIAQLTSIAADLTTCMRALQARQDSFLTLKGEASSPTVHIHGHAIGDQGTGSDHEI